MGSRKLRGSYLYCGNSSGTSWAACLSMPSMSTCTGLSSAPQAWLSTELTAQLSARGDSLSTAQPPTWGQAECLQQCRPGPSSTAGTAAWGLQPGLLLGAGLSAAPAQAGLCPTKSWKTTLEPGDWSQRKWCPQGKGPALWLGHLRASGEHLRAELPAVAQRHPSYFFKSQGQGWKKQDKNLHRARPEPPLLEGRAVETSW